MSTYVPTPVQLGSFTQPADAENINAADVNVPDAAIADGVKFIDTQTTPLADLTALAAILVPTDGLVRHVLGHGFYVFKTTATTGISPFRVAATDLTAGGWMASNAHETTRTRYVPGSKVRGVTAAAQAPAVDTQYNPLAPADGYVFGGGTFVVARSSTHVTNAWGYHIPIDDYLVHGATLASATLKWTPDTSTAPTVLPQMHVCRSIRAGIGSAVDTTTTTMRSGGFAIDTGGTYAATTTRDLVYTTDQNSTIDLATYNYAVVVYDEHGTNATASNAYHSVALAMTGIPDARR